MRILLASNAQYFPAHGGGERSNRMLVEALAARGHQCFVLTRTERFGDPGHRKLETELTDRGVSSSPTAWGLQYVLKGVSVAAATRAGSFRRFFIEQRRAFQPDVIVTSTDDPAQLLLEASLEDERAATVFLARATIALPFGPDAAFTSRQKTDLLRNADGVVGVSEYVARYIRTNTGINAVHVPIALPELGPHPRLGKFENEFVTLANPCAVKGMSIFLALARAFPDLCFAGVPTWGTTSEDLDLMNAQPNITILPKVDDTNDLLAQTRVLLAPSLWAEARSRIVVEAMLAGVPVMASDLGGLPEAKMHIPYILPVNPILAYTQKLNEQMVPVASVPPQDVEPWKQALGRLTSDREHWQELADRSRTVALDYAERTTVEPFETYLAMLKRRPREAVAITAAQPSDQLARLSPERRKLLELRLREQQTGKARPKFRLFCFPHAGATAAFFRSWQRHFDSVAVVPVQYPKRSGTDLAGLARELVETFGAELTGEFAFFGHSMGAIMAFELARVLRRAGRTTPRALIVSAARAPVFRLNHVPGPDPAPAELLEQVKSLGGLPEEVLADPELLELVLPALEADTALYRRYRYEPGEALSIPILVLGGVDDPQVRPEHLKRWREHTSGEASIEMLPGGHFFLRQSEESALSRIREFLTGVRGG